MKNAFEVKYSIKELDELVKRSGTCVTLQRKSRILYLDPVQFSSTKSGFYAFLDVLLLKYDFIFKAIVLGYKKIKLLTECGSFCYRSSKISLQIEADFYLFNPAIGSKLQGVVCKRSGQHLGCLVHKAFNVFIPLNEKNYKTGWDYAIGQEVEFEVVSVDLTTGPLPYIKGKLERKEKDSEEDESEGSVIGAEDGGGYGNVWGGSDSGVASSPGRESDDSEDAESNHSSEGLTRKSLIEEWTYKTPSKRKSKGSFSDEVIKMLGKERHSEDESGVSSSKSLEECNTSVRGGTAVQELATETFSYSQSPKKRKSISKKKKDELSSESEESSSKGFEGCDTSLIGTITQELGAETLSSSQNRKKKKSILKNEMDDLMLEDAKIEGLVDDLENVHTVESLKSALKNEKTSSPKVDKKQERILRNIVRDLSPKGLETGVGKNILETLESTEREESTQEESIGSPKAVKKRKNILKKKKATLSSNIKGMNEDESDAVVSKIDDESIEMHKISKEVPINEAKAEDLTSLPSEKMFNENKLKASETREEGLENGDENVKKKVKRKSMAKKKKTTLLYESIAEQIKKTVGVASEENGETSGKEGLSNINVASPRKPDTEHEKQSGVSGNMKDTSSEDSTKKKSRKSVINLSPLTEGHKTPETEELFVKDDKTSITNSSAKKENGNELIKPDILNRIESSGEAKKETVIAQLEKSTEKGKGRHSLHNSKDTTKKKSRKSEINLLPVTEECKSPITEELLVKFDKTSISITSDKEENGKELVKPNHLGSAESSIISQKRKRESLGEEKNKKRKSTSSATPQAEKTEAEIQIERLLSLNKKLLGIDSVDISEKLSTEEKKSKKRKRGSVGEESPKKKKVDKSPN